METPVRHPRRLAEWSYQAARPKATRITPPTTLRKIMISPGSSSALMRPAVSNLAFFCFRRSWPVLLAGPSPVPPHTDCIPHSAPSNLTGANGLAGKDHCSMVYGAENRRAVGAPLTVILNGKRMFGTVGRAEVVTCSLTFTAAVSSRCSSSALRSSRAAWSSPPKTIARRKARPADFGDTNSASVLLLSTSQPRSAGVT